MKKIFMFCMLAVVLAPASAQVSNPGFENINGQNTGPDRWGPSGFITIPLDTTCTWYGTDSMSFWSWDAHSGNRSYEIRVGTYCPDAYSGMLQARMFFVDTFADQRVPFSGRPDSFTFFYKFTGVGGDRMEGSVSLETADGTQVGAGVVVIDQDAPGWLQGTIPVSYTDTAAPEYIRMVYILASDTILHYGSRFVIDDIDAVFPTSIPSIAGERKVTCYPVPAGDVVYVNLPSTAFVQVQVIDALGRVVERRNVEALTGKLSLPVTELAPGIYSLKISTATDIFTGRFVR